MTKYESECRFQSHVKKWKSRNEIKGKGKLDRVNCANSALTAVQNGEK